MTAETAIDGTGAERRPSRPRRDTASTSSTRSVFVSSDDRLRTALPRHREVALEPAQVEVERQRLHEERDVDVRGEHLLARRLPDLLARDRRAPRQHGLDQLGLGVDADPVADGGQFVVAREAVGRARAHLALLVDEVVGAPVLNGDAGRRRAPRRDDSANAASQPSSQPSGCSSRFRRRKCQPKLLCMRENRARRSPPSRAIRRLGATGDAQRRGERGSGSSFHPCTTSSSTLGLCSLCARRARCASRAKPRYTARARGAVRFRTGSDPGGSSPKDPSPVPRTFA